MSNSIAMRDMGPVRPLAEDVNPLEAQASFPGASTQARNHMDNDSNRPSATELGGSQSEPPGDTRHNSHHEIHGDHDDDNDHEDRERRRRAAGPFKNPRVNTETEISEERGTGPLGVFDIFAFIANKMIGTGIYTAPASVFLLTGRKNLTLGLFGVGFFYSLIRFVQPFLPVMEVANGKSSTFLYLDFAAAFPYTGGELVYVRLASQ